MSKNLAMACLLALPSILFAEKIYLQNSNSNDLNTVSINELTKSALSVDFKLEHFDITSPRKNGWSKMGMKEISFEGLQQDARSGAPMLPLKSILINAKPSDILITATLGAGESFPDLIPAPKEEEKLRCLDCEQKETTLNRDSYRNVNESYRVTYLGDFRGTPISRVDLIPVKYQDGNGTTVYPNAKYTIENKNRAITLNSYTLPANILKEANLNKRYIIVAPLSLMGGLNDFTAWKRSIGYNVTVVSLESIGNSSRQLKNYLQDEYLKNKFSYVLLVGNSNFMPTEFASTSTSYQTPSDLKYFTYGGSDDSIPDVFSGRISADSATEVKNQLSKTIAFEKKTFNDASGLTRHLGLASNEGSNPSDVEYLRSMRAPLVDKFSLNSVSLYQSSYAAQAGEATMISDASSVRTMLNQGVRWISYIGHGSGYEWPSMAQTNFGTNHMRHLAEGVVNPVVIDVACQNGQFSGRGTFGEAFMNATSDLGNPTGALAYYGGSVNISWNPPAIMAVGISRAVKDSGIEHLGEALLAGQLFLAKNFSSGDDFIDNLEWYHLQGDPSLQLEAGPKYNQETLEFVDAIGAHDFAKLTNLLTLSSDKLEFGATVGSDPLLIALTKLNQPSLMELFLNKASSKIEINETDTNGKSALIHAITQGNSELLTILLNAGSSVNQKDKTGSLPLHHAVKAGNANMVSTLINHNSELNVKNKFHCMPRNYANDAINSILKSKKAKRAWIGCKKGKEI